MSSSERGVEYRDIESKFLERKELEQKFSNRKIKSYVVLEEGPVT